MKPEEAQVLVIEDDLNNLIVVTEFLDMIGVKSVHTCESGVQGLMLAEGLPKLDLLLLDIQLPDEDGYAILQRIRAHPRLKDTRVVAVTANVLPQDEAKARAAGFDGFIGKPLNFARFQTQVETLLAGGVVWMPR